MSDPGNYWKESITMEKQVIESKERKVWLDLLRGTAVLFVIFGHIAKSERLFFSVTSPIKIPLFFMISGYLFGRKLGSAKSFFMSLLRHVVIPWMVLSLLWARIPYEMIRGKWSNIPGLIYDYLSGKELWYMPCCIVAEILFFLLLKLIRNKWILSAVVFGVAAGGYILSLNGLGDFMLVNVACTSQLFLLLGYLFRENEYSIREKLRIWMVAAGTALYIGLCALSQIYYPDGLIDAHHNKYDNIFLAAAMILVGNLLLFRVAPHLPKLRWLVFVGQNALVFYILHYYIRIGLDKGLSMMKIHLPDNLLGYLIEMLIVCLLLTVVAYLIGRFIPWAAGKKKRPKKIDS